MQCGIFKTYSWNLTTQTVHYFRIHWLPTPTYQEVPHLTPIMDLLIHLISQTHMDP